MDNIKFCPNCGSQINQGDKFCGECGFNIELYNASLDNNEDIERNNLENTDKFSKIVEKPNLKVEDYNSNKINNKLNKYKNKKMIVFVLILALLVGIFMIMYNLKNQKNNNIVNPTIDGNIDKDTNKPKPIDLTKATTYLSKPGIKFTAFVNYPNGVSAIVERISGLGEFNNRILVSEVEVGIEYGEEYGYVFHYIEKQDGTYYIIDNYPDDIFPMLKNNLEIGSFWNFVDDYGVMEWTVIDMDKNLDLGFKKFENCLLIREDNKTTGNVVITYYAPGFGIVYVVSPDREMEYYKLTDMEYIDSKQASEIIIKWSQNYFEIENN